jgi:hypothetical protein
MEKAEFLKGMMELCDKLAQSKKFNENPRSHISKTEVLNHLSKTMKVLELARVHKQTEAFKAEFAVQREAAKKNSKRLLFLRKEVLKLATQDGAAGIINKKHSTAFSSEEIILYACKISNFCQSVPKKRTIDTLYPWSFGENKVELAEMECSYLYSMYKNNPHYRRLNPPKIMYLKESESNILDTRQIQMNEYQIVARGNLQIFIQKEADELYVYTLDGREPNKYLAREPLPEIISVYKDSVVKILGFKPGFIDSPTTVFHIKIEDPGTEQDDGHGLEKLVRPVEIKDELSDNFNGYEDLFNDELNFTSLHVQESYSTPNN